jgi:hypothetical protein
MSVNELEQLVRLAQIRLHDLAAWAGDAAPSASPHALGGGPLGYPLDAASRWSRPGCPLGRSIGAGHGYSCICRFFGSFIPKTPGDTATQLRPAVLQDGVLRTRPPATSPTGKGAAPQPSTHRALVPL